MASSSTSDEGSPKVEFGEQTYHLMFDRCPLPMWVFDQETFEFLDVNAAAVRHYGYSREEFLGMTVLDIRPRVDSESVRAYIQSHPPDALTYSEKAMARHCLRSGEIRDVEITWGRVELGGRPAILVLAVDITDRLKAESEREEYRTRLEAIIGATSDAVWDWNLANNDLWWGEGIHRLFGHFDGPTNVTIQWWEDQIHPEDREAVMSSLSLAINGSENKWRDVYRFRMGNGQFAYVEDHASILRDGEGKAHRMLGGMADITHRINSERELERSEQRLRAVARATNDAIWEWDFASQRVIWSDGVHRLFHYPSGSVEGTAQWWVDHIHPVDRERVTTGIYKAIDGADTEWVDEYRFQRGDGTYAHVIDRGAIMRDENGFAESMIGGMTDLSERLEANRILEEGRIFIEKAQKVADIGSWQRTMSGDSRRLVWSSNVFNIFGVTEHEFDETVDFFESRVHPDDVPKTNEAFVKALDTGAIYEVDHRIVRPDGEIRWVREYGEILRDENGEPLNVIGIVQDITDRKKMEEALKTSESRFQRLFDSNIISVLIGDMDGVILDANDAFLAMIGCTREQLEAGGIPADSVTAGGLSDDDFNAIAQLRDHKCYDPFEKAFKRPDGTIVHVLLGGMMLNDGENVTINFAVDISELVQARRALESANVYLEEKVAERTTILQEQYRHMAALKEVADEARAEADAANRAKSEFLSRMSHELRTPMNAILGFAQLLELDDLPEDSQSSVAQILKAGDHLLVLINEVLDLSRIDSGRLNISPERVRLRDVIEEVIELCRPSFDKYQVSVSWDAGALDRAYVMADASRLRQVFINLVSNASKYNRPCGQIRISLEMTDEDFVRTRISDTGIGIPADKMHRLFKPFDRLGRELSEIEGSGLGLALAKRLVDVMNGRFDLQSVPDEGTTVLVDMVVAKPPADSEDSDRSTSSTPMAVPRILEGRSSTVLYIEDNLSNMELVQRIFRTTGGVRLLSAVQGGAGIEIALENNPDLILLDLNLPDLDGLGVLNRLRADERTAGIPVIVITADANPRQRDRLMEAGANDFMTKPINVTELVTKVRGILLGEG